MKVRVIWMVLFIIGFCVRSTDVFHLIDTESWREADMATIAKNFYQNGMNIFHPQIAWDGSGPGYTESEFQIYTYLIALSYKIFGIWEPTGRIISFLFSLGTMIVFFKLCKYLFKTETAIAVSSFFVLSPLLMTLSNAIQPESEMFFFYILSAYTFIRWIDSQSKRDYFLAIIFTVLTILCKLTAAHIGLMFVLLIIIKKGGRFLLTPKVLIFGFLSLLPSIIWYLYCHQFYINYGNSIGISNEYALVGWDFFTNRSFIRGIIQLDIIHVWTSAGIIIVFLGVIFTNIIKKESTVIPICWLASVSIFYFLIARTAESGWAFWYHIFSIPAASILLGSCVIELYNKYSPWLNLNKKTTIDRLNFIKGILIISFLTLLVFYFAVCSFKYLVQTKTGIFTTSDFYSCKSILLEKIPQGSLILASGSISKDDAGHSHAYNSSYFFYWLNQKGYNISSDNQSIENVILFKNKGAKFFIAEKHFLQRKPGLEGDLKKRFKLVLECNGIILFEL